VAILSVDLAYRRWSDLGVVILSRVRQQPPGFPLQDGQANEVAINCEIIPFGPTGLDSESVLGGGGSTPIDPEILAGRLNHLCAIRDIRILMLDGPQAWKSQANGLAYARGCERQLNTAAKTGLPGMIKPLPYRPFAEFCMDVYDALSRRGWRRLETRAAPDLSEQLGSPAQRLLVESYPHAAWKSMGLKPLPSKRHARICDLAEAYEALRALVPFTANRPPNHDQLQAIVAGLPGLALEERDPAAVRIVGNPPRREEGHWREGFIVLPLRPTPHVPLRWLH
jgi:hypothetical protein